MTRQETLPAAHCAAHMAGALHVPLAGWMRRPDPRPVGLYDWALGGTGTGSVHARSAGALLPHLSIGGGGRHHKDSHADECGGHHQLAYHLRSPVARLHMWTPWVSRKFCRFYFRGPAKISTLRIGSSPMGSCDRA